MSSPSSPVRYHSLDALRATAMLLGILLHVAWIMGPSYLMTPITDVSGNYYCHYFLHAVHMFRMQVFFLIAGFFARLVLQRRGTWGFIRHRLLRIGLPLLLGWLILFPFMSFYYTWGGLLSGRVLSDKAFAATAWEEFVGAVTSQLPLIHLWFLYFLLLIYALVLALRVVFIYVLDRRGRLRNRIDGLFARVIRSRWNVLWLAIPSAVLLWLGNGWFGIEADAWMLIPSLTGVLGYWVFFAVGWLLYGQVSLLDECTKRWRLHLTLGVASSLPLVGIMIRYVDSGIITPLYPVVWVNDIHDYPGMRDQLLAAGEDSENSPRRAVWDALSPLYQESLEERTEIDSDQAAGLGFHLFRRVVLRRNFYRPEDWREGELPPDVAELAKLPAGERSFGQTMLLNRKLLEAALPGHISPDVRGEPFYRGLKVAYACGYAIAMWLLVFGTMGLFMHFFGNPSRFLRYVADSSYWLYLIHLPVLFQIEVYVAQVEMNWIVKFLMYNLLAVAVLIPSYHYLVRSTFIGKLLNGRTHPFVPWFRRKTGETTVAPEIDADASQPADV